MLDRSIARGAAGDCALAIALAGATSAATATRRREVCIMGVMGKNAAGSGGCRSLYANILLVRSNGGNGATTLRAGETTGRLDRQGARHRPWRRPARRRHSAYRPWSY